MESRSSFTNEQMIQHLNNNVGALANVGDRIRNNNINEGRISVTLNTIEQPLDLYLGNISNIEIYNLECFISAHPSVSFILAQPHLISIVGIGLYCEAQKTLDTGGFVDIINRVLRNKKTGTYIFSSNFGLYNPWFVRYYSTLRTNVTGALNQHKFAVGPLISLVTFGLGVNSYITQPNLPTASEIVRNFLNSRSGFNDPQLDKFIHNSGKIAFEVGRLFGDVAKSAYVGFLSSSSTT